jgi:hypothetical protein
VIGIDLRGGGLSLLNDIDGGAFEFDFLMGGGVSERVILRELRMRDGS